MVQMKQPASTGTNSLTPYMQCVVTDLDLTNMIAHVTDQLGGKKTVSLTRFPGKPMALPVVGEQWIITSEYGGWTFAISINNGMAINATNLPTPSTLVERDTNGRAQVVDPAVSADIATKNYVDTSSTNTAFAPTGVTLPFAGTTAPTGWYVADGSAVSRTGDAALFAVIGTTYGVGDGSTTFNLPNLLGKVPVGHDAGETEFAAVGQTGGEKTHTLSATEMPSHTHTATVTDPQHAHGPGTYGMTQSTATGASLSNRVSNVNTQGTTSTIAVTGTSSSSATGITVGNANTGGGAAHNNLQPYIAMNYIIKR